MLNCCGIPLQRMIQSCLAVKDLSIDEEAKFLEIHVLSFDRNGEVQNNLSKSMQFFLRYFFRKNNNFFSFIFYNKK